jgi:hypothetical protein
MSYSNSGRAGSGVDVWLAVKLTSSVLRPASQLVFVVHMHVLLLLLHGG